MVPACLPPRDVTRPQLPPPPDACDTHAVVFGPAARFPYAEARSHTPTDAPLEKYRMLDTTCSNCFNNGRRTWRPSTASSFTNPATLYGFPN
jgi:hypothetical protein